MFSLNKLFFVFAAVLSVSGCFEDKNADQSNNKMPVNVEVMQMHDIPLKFEFAARAQGSKETEVRARVGGILLKRNYIEGAEVEEGSVLFEIDPEPYQVTLDQAKAKLEQIRAELKNAKTQLDRTKKLFEQKYASEKAYDDAVAAYDSLQASLLLAQAEVDAARLNLDYTQVKAPISGLTSMEAQSEGSLISTSGNSGLLTNITQLDPIYVMFSLSENEMMMMSDMIASGKLKNPENKDALKAWLRLGNGLMYDLPGEINFINPGLDSSTGTIKLRAVFPNPKKRLRPGQFVRLSIEGFVRGNALTVPQQAVMQGANGAYVYVVEKDGKLEEKEVKISLTADNGRWIIDSGLADGDMVVVDNLLKLRPGMVVDPVVISTETTGNK